MLRLPSLVLSSTKLPVGIRSLSSLLKVLSDMPTTNDTAERLRQHRIQKQKNRKTDVTIAKGTASHIDVQVLGNGGHGVPSCVYVFTPTARYLFNCGEGTQKLCQENKVKMHKFGNLFFTSPTWRNLGGLMGFALTVQDQGVPELQLHGHKHIIDLFEMTRNFSKIHLVQIGMHPKLEFDDDVMKVKYVILKKATGGDGQAKRSHFDDDTIPDSAVVCYLCEPHPKPGRLKLEDCVNAGVPPGPLFSKLKAGEEVTLEDGRIVKPADVVSVAEYTPAFIVLECPSEDYVDSLLEATELQPYQLDCESPSASKTLALIVHMTPKDVYDSKPYQAFIKKFPESTTHIHLCEDNCNESSVASFRAQYRLNLIHNDVFPCLPRSTQGGVACLAKYAVRPPGGLQPESAIQIIPEEYIEEAKQSPGFEEAYNQLQANLASTVIDDTREYPAVTFLGTGSAIPSKDRNVSGILVATQPDCYILLDCGEGTWAQLVRHFGAQEAEKILRHLQAVYVSHMHADHHLGLISILKNRAALGISDKLRVIGPTRLPAWLDSYGSTFEEIAFDFSNCAAYLTTDEASEYKRFELTGMGVDAISTCRVVHCKDAFGVRIDVAGYSVVYSGDTRPSQKLVELGRGCDLLIHEATMETRLKREAEIKMHSTIAQAIQIGQQMEAKFTLLTHFSQRYSKLPFVDDAIFSDGRVGCAVDHMRVCPKHLKVLPLIYPMLKCIYSEHLEAMTQRTLNLVKRQEREEQYKHEEEKDLWNKRSVQKIANC